MPRSAADEYRQYFREKNVIHKGVKIQLEPGFRTLRPSYRVGNNDYNCDTIDEAVKKANYLARKNRKTKPIPVLRAYRSSYKNATILEIHENGDVVIKDDETNKREKIPKFRVDSALVADTPGNRTKLEKIIETRKKIESLDKYALSTRKTLGRVKELKERG